MLFYHLQQLQAYAQAVRSSKAPMRARIVSIPEPLLCLRHEYVFAEGSHASQGSPYQPASIQFQPSRHPQSDQFFLQHG